FGMAKKDTKQVQILPNISVKAGKIPPIEMGGHFKYLGRNFDFKMDDAIAKSEILTKVEVLLKSLSELEIKPQTKLKIFNRYIPSQLSFYLRTYSFSSTWVAEQIDALCIRHIRQWIEAPVSSCVSEWLITPNKKCGMGIPSFINRLELLQLSKRFTLKNSNNESIRDLWKDSSPFNVPADSLLVSMPFNAARKSIITSQHTVAENHLLGLLYQGKAIKTITECVPENIINEWVQVSTNLPGYLFNFVIKALQSQLPTLANMARWGKSSTNLCPICGQPQTNKHVLSNCSNPDALASSIFKQARQNS
ncbi:MAG: hypothetical protein ACHQ1D_12585, partial [Nitrososphaerales archaeon]